MTIPGSLPPVGGPNRAAQAYGLTPRRAPSAAGQPPKVESPSAAADSRQLSGSLRSVLNDEERAYFDQISSLGPITYDRNARGGMVPEVPRGLRLDVRG